jgi:hypothetical protein
MKTMIVTPENDYETYQELEQMNFKGAWVKFQFDDGQEIDYGWARKDEVLWYCLRILWDAKLVISF